MATLELIKEAVLALKDRTGSSIPAIKKWIETEKKVAVPKPHILKAALKSGVEKGILVKVKASYKVSAEAKKPKKKKAAPKKKKAAPKKKKAAPKKKTATKKAKAAPKKKATAKKAAPKKKTAPKKKKTASKKK